MRMYYRKRIKWWGGFLVVCMVILTAGTTAYASPKKMIKIGVLAMMKAVVGQQEAAGVSIAADEINKAGGVRVGREMHKIDVVVTDTDEGENLIAGPSAMERLININKVDFFIGGYRTEAVIAMQEVMADYRKIFISSGFGPQISARLAKNYDRYKYWFRMNPNVIFYNRSVTYGLGIIADKIRKELGIDKPKVALLLGKMQALKPIPNYIKSLDSKLGVETTKTWWVLSSPPDLSTELTAIKNSGAHIILTFLATGSSNMFTKQWAELKVPVAAIGYNDYIQQSRHCKQGGGFCDYAATVLTVASGMEITPKTQPLVKKFAERIGELPVVQGVGSYDAVFTLKEAIERAGTLESEAVVRELEKTDHIGAQGRISYFPKDHKLPHDMISGLGYVPYVCVQWQDGEVKGFWPDGRATYDEQGWKGVKYPGTVEYKLPPWMKTYWKSKK